MKTNLENSEEGLLVTPKKGMPKACLSKWRLCQRCGQDSSTVAANLA